jgi:hypothetical protein
MIVFLIQLAASIGVVVVAILTPGERAQRRMNGRQGGHTSWARTEDRSARTAPARAAALARFEVEVDPDGVLPPEERARRAESARRAYFVALARKSAASRKKASTS